MPEIKHNFTGGKMNKDLDERLVPNGEYTDAMNIQVSTSEGSDVGTAQNILGNYLIPNQSYFTDENGNQISYVDSIYEGYKCVGSISDEANDKLYFFITNGTPLDIEPIQDWTDSQNNWILNNNGASAIYNSYGFLQSSSLNLQDGVRYEITYDQVVAPTYNGTLKIWQGTGNPYINIGGPGLNTDLDVLSSSSFLNKPSRVTAQWVKTSTNFAIEDDTDYNGTIKNVEILEVKASKIIQYDTVTKEITPVFVDRYNTVLKFRYDKVITGINIINDLLFWTDNLGEPKKININRCIQGTNVQDANFTHTQLINEPRGITKDIEEKHITVIKPAPKAMLNAQVATSGPAPGKINAGIFRTSASQSGSTAANDSSLRTVDEYWNNSGPLMYNFDNAFGALGHKFYMEIETDTVGQSGFTLDYAVGDTLLLKAYDLNFTPDGVPTLTQPDLPLNDWNLKVKIFDTGANSFVDAASDMIENSDLSIPNISGTNPEGWGMSPSASALMTYNANDSRMEINAPGSANSYEKYYYKTASMPLGSFVNNRSYTIIVNVSNYVSGELSPRILVDGDIYSGNNFPYIYYNNDGTIATNCASDGDHIFNINTGGYKPIPTTDMTFYMQSGPLVLQTSNIGYVGHINSVTVIDNDSSNARVGVKIVGRQGSTPSVPPGFAERKYVVDKLLKDVKPFEFKFPRFAYRWKYLDNEYSTISPFTNVVFEPGAFNYHPTEGYNIGMTNNVTNIGLKNWTSDMPDDVYEVEILYKNEVSPNIYIVDTLSATSNSGKFDAPNYNINSEMVKSAIPSDQILRSWDNVPKKALAQDVSGNRIIYGNYVQGYDLDNLNNLPGINSFEPSFNFAVFGEHQGLNAVKSIKSLREYQLGVVFLDKYGRETPVISNETFVDAVEQDESQNQNKLVVSFNNDNYPLNMEYMKFFVKETSGEYYNMAMDRFYDAGDNNVWITFPSSERNKIDLDTFLILKKGLESNDQIIQKARYKVLAIENEAPEDIKYKKLKIESKTHDTTQSGTQFDVFADDIDDAPLVGVNVFKLKYQPFFQSTGSDLHNEEGLLYIEFEDKTNGITSNRYRVSSVTTDWDGLSAGAGTAYYSFITEKPFEGDVSFIVNNSSNPTAVENGISFCVYRYSVENTKEFTGRFFVKINNDDIFNGEIAVKSVIEEEYRVAKTRKLYFMNGTDHNIKHSHNVTGQRHGAYHDDSVYQHVSNGGGIATFNPVSGNDDSYFTWITGIGIDSGTVVQRDNHFGRFAPFFRNYEYTESSEELYDAITPYDGNNLVPSNIALPASTTEKHAGQYRFGNDTNDWKFEITYITTPINDTYMGYYKPAGDTDPTYACVDPGTGAALFGNTGFNIKAKAKIADGSGYTASERAGKFNSKMEQEKGEVWFIDKGKYEGYRYDPGIHWQYTSPNQGQRPGIDTANGKINIGMGGIYYEDVGYSTYGSTSAGGVAVQGVFGVGHYDVYGENPNYQHDGIVKLVNKFYPGSKFRWKDDPTREVYTIQTGQKLWRPFRHSSTEFPYARAYSSGDWPLSGQTTSIYHGDQTQVLAQLSTNTSVTWDLPYRNSSGTKTMNWDPTNGGTLGPIPNGLYLPTTNAISATVYTTHLVLRLSSLTCTDPVFGSRDISEGMIMTSYNNGGVSLDGSNSHQELLVHRIVPVGNNYDLRLIGYREPNFSYGTTGGLYSDMGTYKGTPIRFYAHESMRAGGTAINTAQQIIFQQAAMNGYSQYSVNRINAQDQDQQGFSLSDPGVGAVGYEIEFLEEIDAEPEMPTNPAIWETEPKETTTDIDLYYEASNAIPIKLNLENYENAIPRGSAIAHVQNANSINSLNRFYKLSYHSSPVGTSWPSGTSGYYLEINNKFGDPLLDPIVGGQYINVGDQIKITSISGQSVSLTVTGWWGATNISDGRIPSGGAGIYINESLYNQDTEHELSWYNCISFGNGVESDRIRDSFNLQTLTNGAKVSTTFDPYKEEHRKYGLIFSGIYNSISGENGLNQFIAANKITKDVNPIYGSIQKLHSRDSDILALCEDKILKILANKDAVFNADGNSQLTANINVLGQTVPFVGEYGISKNPESFVSEAYRAYFTDKVRGAVIRLSRDGLTPISDHGMKDWFRDNLKLNKTLIGSYDDKKEEYNISLQETNDTVSFREDVKGWVSFKSFTPENAVSCANEYYTLKSGRLYHHHNENSLRNTFYLDAVEVENIGPHPSLGTNGQYFWFNPETFITLDGWSGTSTWITKIKQYRKGELIYDGAVALFGSLSGNALENEQGQLLAHGRRELDPGVGNYGLQSTAGLANSGAASGQWQVGDLVVIDPGVNNLNARDKYTESSVNLLFNDNPGSVKTFHTLDYEGSQARTEGLRHVKVIDNDIATSGFNAGDVFVINEEGIDKLIDMIGPVTSDPYPWYIGDTYVKVYREINGIVQYVTTGQIQFYPNGDFTDSRPVGYFTTQNNDWKVGDIITTFNEERSIGAFNTKFNDGWYTETVKTNKQEGSLIEFVEKEGKWFNYIRGLNSTVTTEIDVGSFNAQGLGSILDVEGFESGTAPGSQNKFTINFSDNINSSVSIGDTIYTTTTLETTITTIGPDLVPNMTLANGWSDSAGTLASGIQVDWSNPNNVILDHDGFLPFSFPQQAHVNIISPEITLVDGNTYEATITTGNIKIGGVIDGDPNAVTFSVHGGGSTINFEPMYSNQTATYQFTFNEPALPGANLSSTLNLQFFVMALIYGGGWSDGTSTYVEIQDMTLKDITETVELGENQLQNNLFGTPASDLFKLGTVLDYTDTSITIATDPATGVVDTFKAQQLVTAYTMFVKPEVVNTSSLLGYFADVNIKNNSLVKAELFSVGAEVTESSK